MWIRLCKKCLAYKCVSHEFMGVVTRKCSSPLCNPSLGPMGDLRKHFSALKTTLSLMFMFDLILALSHDMNLWSKILNLLFYLLITTTKNSEIKPKINLANLIEHIYRCCSSKRSDHQKPQNLDQSLKVNDLHFFYYSENYDKFIKLKL